MLLSCLPHIISNLSLKPARNVSLMFVQMFSASLCNVTLIGSSPASSCSLSFLCLSDFVVLVISFVALLCAFCSVEICVLLAVCIGVGGYINFYHTSGKYSS